MQSNTSACSPVRTMLATFTALFHTFLWAFSDSSRSLGYEGQLKNRSCYGRYAVCKEEIIQPKVLANVCSLKYSLYFAEAY